MEDRQFDSFVKQLAVSKNRRSLLRGLVGIGTAAIAGSAGFRGGAEAARRPTPTPIPVKCPGRQVWSDGQCRCPEGYDKCGPDCCQSGTSMCCDNACCNGYCYGEEQCCEAPRQYCEATGECCPEGSTCCPGVGCLTSDQCCERNDCPERNCYGRSCSNNTCYYQFECYSGNGCCDTGDPCTASTCSTTSGQCSAPSPDCRLNPELCCTDGEICLDNGTCCEPVSCTGRCGMIDDGCGHQIDCGNTCPPFQICVDGICDDDGVCTAGEDWCIGGGQCSVNGSTCTCSLGLDGESYCTSGVLGGWEVCGSCLSNEECVEKTEYPDALCLRYTSNCNLCGVEGGVCGLPCGNSL